MGALHEAGIGSKDGAREGSSKEVRHKAREDSTREQIEKVRDVKTNIAVKTWSRRFH